MVEGDLFKDPLPSGHDAMILANTIHVLSAEHNILLLENMRRRVEIALGCCWSMCGWMQIAVNRLLRH